MTVRSQPHSADVVEESDLDATQAIGFDDGFQYEDFTRPLADRRIKIEQFRPDLGAEAYAVWMAKADRHPY